MRPYFLDFTFSISTRLPRFVPNAIVKTADPTVISDVTIPLLPQSLGTPRT
jgi:hypothetical protein